MFKKAIFIFLVVLALFLELFFGDVYGGDRYWIKEADSSDVAFEIQGTDVDYSREYKSNDVMTIFYVAYDQIAQDSVNITMEYQVQGVDGWYTDKTRTVTADSTEGAWKITSTATASGRNYRIKVYGNSGNRTDGEVIFKMKMDEGR